MASIFFFFVAFFFFSLRPIPCFLSFWRYFWSFSVQSVGLIAYFLSSGAFGGLKEDYDCLVELVKDVIDVLLLIFASYDEIISWGLPSSEIKSTND